MYECKICNYSSKLKANYTRHLSSLKHIRKCQNIQNMGTQNSVCTHVYTKNTPNYSNFTPEYSKITQNYTKNIQKNEKTNNNDDKHCEEKTNNNLICIFCGKCNFKRNCDLQYHMNNRCKKNNTYIDIETNNVDKTENELDYKKLLEFMTEEHKKRDLEQQKLIELLKNQDSNKIPLQQIKEELKEEIHKIVKESYPSSQNIDQINLTNKTTTNTGTYFEATNQHNLLNNLNLNFNNIISMNQFLHNLEHVNKIPASDLEAIAYASENMSEGDLADTIHMTLEKNCVEQTTGVFSPLDGKELLPVMPIVCSDGNCRSHKEKVDKFWETVYGDKHFDHMLNIIDKRIFEVLRKKIYLEEHSKKKLFKKIKRKHTIHDMKKLQEKINGPLENII